MSLFKKKSSVALRDPADDRFNAMVALTKDLKKRDYNRTREAMDLIWTAQQKIRSIGEDDGTTTEQPTEFLTGEEIL